MDLVADRLDAAFAQEKYRGLIAQAKRGEDVLLVKPLTYMNNSGDCIGRVVRYKNVTPADLLVVVDDVNLPLGKLRLRAEGSPGGHNGLRSLVEYLGTEDFARLRMGVGPSESRDLRSYVLGRFTPEERPLRDEMVARAADAVFRFLDEGLAQAMNRFN